MSDDELFVDARVGGVPPPAALDDAALAAWALPGVCGRNAAATTLDV